jgi:hypothetical protein
MVGRYESGQDERGAPTMAKKIVRFGSVLSTLAAVLLSGGGWWKY